MDSGDIVSLRVRIKGGHAVSASAQVPFSHRPHTRLAPTDPCLSRAAETAGLRVYVRVWLSVLLHIYQQRLGARTV